MGTEKSIAFLDRAQSSWNRAGRVAAQNSVQKINRRRREATTASRGRRIICPLYTGRKAVKLRSPEPRSAPWAMGLHAFGEESEATYLLKLFFGLS